MKTICQERVTVDSLININALTNLSWGDRCINNELLDPLHELKIACR